MKWKVSITFEDEVEANSRVEAKKLLWHKFFGSREYNAFGVFQCPYNVSSKDKPWVADVSASKKKDK